MNYKECERIQKDFSHHIGKYLKKEKDVFEIKHIVIQPTEQRQQGLFNLSRSIQGNWEKAIPKFIDKDLEVILECKKIPSGELEVLPISDIEFLV
ncbi:MAG: hypothetical protein H0W84_10515 [Bacteroidetes bacterium]|nr:hypothetical protein [Bacteroidota bacterium]